MVAHVLFRSLRVAWTLGLLLVITWAFVGTFVEKGYLERHVINSGVARLKIVDSTELPLALDGQAYLQSRHHGNWYAEDLIMQMGSAEVLIVTKVKEELIHHSGKHTLSRNESVVQMEQDRAEKMLRDLVVASHDNPQAGNLPLEKGNRRRFFTTKEMQGVFKRFGGGKSSECGTLWARGTDEIQIPAGERDELRLVDVVCAAGINASDEAEVQQLVRKGITVSLTYSYFQAPSAGIFDHLRGDVPVMYELTAEAYPAQAKTRVVERHGHAGGGNADGEKDVRMRRSVVGITLEVCVHVEACLCIETRSCVHV
jgi:hypothetical protein